MEEKTATEELFLSEESLAEGEWAETFTSFIC